MAFNSTVYIGSTVYTSVNTGDDALDTAEEANGDFRSLVDTYTQDGRPAGAFRVGAMGLAGIVSAAHQDLVDAEYQNLLGVDSSADYSWGSSLGKVAQLLVYSGNYVNSTGLDGE